MPDCIDNFFRRLQRTNRNHLSGFVGLVAGGLPQGRATEGGVLGGGVTSRTKLGLPALAVTLAAAGIGRGQRSEPDKQVVCLGD